MISRALAQRLRDAGLVWRPRAGDAFQLARADTEAADVGPDGSESVFVISDMTIEPHHYPTGTVLGFNGTTEWALDSVALADALWFPREDQLRDALRSSFERLERTGDPPSWTVTTVFRGERTRITADAPDEAYGLAVLEQVLAANA